MTKTKKVGDEDRPARCFAYVPDPDKPSTWKLPIYYSNGAVDRERLPKAYAAVFSNYRGEKADIPKNALPGVIAKLKTAYRKAKMKWPKNSEAMEMFTEGAFGGMAENEEGTLPKKWEVQLINKGLSKNGVYYSESVLKASAKLFEGARAIDRSDSDHTLDMNSSVKSTIGYFGEVEYREGSRPGLYGNLHLFPSGMWLSEILIEAQKAKQKHLFGLSIVAYGEMEVKRHMGQTVREATKITEVVSCDPVTRPAAGGRFIKMAAGETTLSQEGILMFDKIIETIKAKRPDLLDGKDLENITESELTVLLAEAMAPVQPKEPAKKEDPPDDLTKKLDLMTEMVKKQECRFMLKEALAASKLPDQARERILQTMGNTIFTEAQVAEAIKKEADYIASLNPTPGGNGDPITEGVSQREKVLAALDGFFLREPVKVGNDMVPPFRSFREAYIMITGDKNITGRMSEAVNLRHYLMTEGLYTGSWAQILGDSVTRAMIREYQLPALQDWRKIVSEISKISDFRTNRRMRMGGYGVLSTVNERGNYQELTSPGDEEATYAITKKGGLESLTLEMVANDDVGAIRRIPMLLGRAAGRTLYKALFDIFTANSGQGEACSYDAANLFASGGAHANYGTTALSQAALSAVRHAMRSQASYGDSYEILGGLLLPKYLIVPNELEETAVKLCTSPVTLISAGTTEISNMPNLHQGMEPIVVDYWTDTNNWYVSCDPRNFPTIEVGFFNGQENPELFLQDAPEIGSMFAADKLTWKVRHIWGYCILDHRGLYGSVVS